MKAQEKYENIKRLAEGHLSKEAAAVRIGCTTRHVSRLLHSYQQKGKAGFLHGNTARKPAHALTDEDRAAIVFLYNNKYWDTNFTHACELLAEHDSIRISPSCLRSILLKAMILSPRATRSTRKTMKQHLESLQRSAKTKKEKHDLAAGLVRLEDSHCRRPRCAYLGEMLQMDASVHLWFGQSKTHLHVAIDDCTSTIVGAYFDQQETLLGYYNVFHQVLTNYGIPAMFYTDNRTVFAYKNKKMKDIGDDTFTQFSYACKQLGVEIKTTSVAQAKGRVERLFQTLQSRLPVELRLKGITTINEANAFLNSYIKEYNAKFALPIHDSKSVFVVQPDSDTIDQTLAILTPRTVDNGHCIKFRKKYYKLMDSQGIPAYYHRGVKGLVIQTFQGTLLFSTNDQVYALDEIPLREQTSKNFDIQPMKERPKTRTIPSPQHPWRYAAFQKYIPFDYFPDGFPA